MRRSASSRVIESETFMRSVNNAYDDKLAPVLRTWNWRPHLLAP